MSPRQDEIRDILLSKIKTLSDTIWDQKAREPQINAWLDNFITDANGTYEDRALHALYLLSRFMYFGNRQMRELMRVLFRDLYRYPIVQQIRKTNGDTTDIHYIRRAFQEALDKTLFLGVGNPSESGSHLLYYFRQENGLPRTRFIHGHEIFKRSHLSMQNPYAATLSLRDPSVDRYVFIDDFCGSGRQAEAYSKGIVDDIKVLNPAIQVLYFVLLGTKKGMDAVRQRATFNIAQCVFELDESFQCFSSSSRYFPSPWPEITHAFGEDICRTYGETLDPKDPLGYGNCQLLLGFQHNIPDNTLPIFWSEGSQEKPWVPLFKRYPKIYQ